jgi:hypothetical protein
LALLVVAAFASAGPFISKSSAAEDLRLRNRLDVNLLEEALKTPSDPQHFLLDGVAEALAKSQVPTQQEAARLAMLSTFLSGEEFGPKVVGLFRLGRDTPDFGKVGDLFWEVRIFNAPGFISRVIWVSTTTKKSRVLFP